VLFSGSLRFNIGLRLPDEDDGAIIRAAEAAGAHPFILDLPEGYGTDAGELGHRLSAGQRQRIAIARALVGDPAVLLFDEPSSHLDRQAEADLRRLLLDAAATRTVVMVTHSPVLLAASQTLTVLERGRIAFHGPPGDVRFEGTRAVEPAGGDRAASPAEPQDLPPPQIAARTAARSTR
jgi:ATP-binding cassette subfamily C protein LapB